MFSLLRQRNFALLWLGGLISMMGDWMLFIGLPIYVYQLSGSALATSFMFIAQIVPRILLSSLAGVFVDRWDRRRTMIVSNLLLALGLLPLVWVQRADQLWLVYAVAFCQSVIRQFFGPAEDALLPRLVRDEELLRANVLNALNNQLARLVGPPLGGFAAAYLGMGSVALLDAASFLLAALLIAQVRIDARPLPATAETAPTPPTGLLRHWRALWQEWLAGLGLVARNPVLTVMFWWMAITSLGEGAFGVLIVVFVNQIWQGGAAEIGWLMSAQAVGGILGGLIADRVEKRFSRVQLIAFGSLAFGLLDLALFNVHRMGDAWWILLLLMGLVGVPGVWVMTAIQTVMQTSVADHYRGRVFGARGAVMALLGLVGTTLAGVLGDRLPVVALLNLQAGGYLLAGMLVLFCLGQAMHRQATQAQPPSTIQEMSV